MKILLVNPLIPLAFRFMNNTDEEVNKAIDRRVMVGPPLALNELAGMCIDEEIVILDQKMENEEAKGDYDYLGRFTEEFHTLKPDIVGVTCMTAQFNAANEILNHAKKLNPDVLTLVGGMHPTMCSEGFVGSNADILSIGIGKHSFKMIVELVKAYGPKADFTYVPGIALNKGNHLFYTKSLCELGYEEVKNQYYYEKVMPNRSLTDKYDYRIKQVDKNIHYLSTSQGCTHKCNFCSIWQTTGGRYFYKTVDTIIDEIKTMDKYKVIRFCDANTFGDIKSATKLFTRIIEEGLDFHEYMVDARTDTVLEHPEVIELAVKAGLKIAICGLEASSDEELAAYNKSNTIAKISKALKLFNSMGVLVNGNYIVKPDYMEKDFERIGEFVENNPIYHSGFSILTPFPGTPLWDEMKDDIVIDNFDYYNLTNAVVKTTLPEKEFYDQVSTLYKRSRRATEQYFRTYGKPMVVR